MHPEGLLNARPARTEPAVAQKLLTLATHLKSQTVLQL